KLTQVPACRAQHLARIRIADNAQRVVDRAPRARSDSLVVLRHRLACRRFQQEEMTELVDQRSAVAEVPVDRGQLRDDLELDETGFLRDLEAPGRLPRCGPSAGPSSGTGRGSAESVAHR